MMEALGSYIKLAVDIEHAILAGAGEFHADCEARLLVCRSQQANVLGADWIPATQEVRFEALINMRSEKNNPSMAILDQNVRGKAKAVTRSLLET